MLWRLKIGQIQKLRFLKDYEELLKYTWAGFRPDFLYQAKTLLNPKSKQGDSFTRSLAKRKAQEQKIALINQ